MIAFLTILGYSLYDTIVVFDKVQENTRGLASTNRLTYTDTVNLSMNQVLARSLNTSLVAILPILSILVIGAWVLGATALKDFGLALFVGLTTGAYSSIFIASPLLALLKEREPRYAEIRRRLATRPSAGRRITPAAAATGDLSGAVGGSRRRRRRRPASRPGRRPVPARPSGPNADGDDVAPAPTAGEGGRRRRRAPGGRRPSIARGAHRRCPSLDPSSGGSRPGRATARRPGRARRAGGARRHREPVTGSARAAASIVSSGGRWWMDDCRLAEGPDPGHPRLPAARRGLQGHHPAAGRRRGLRWCVEALADAFAERADRQGASASRPGASSSPPPSPSASGPASCRCARPASCRGRSTARTYDLEYGVDSPRDPRRRAGARRAGADHRRRPGHRRHRAGHRPAGRAASGAEVAGFGCIIELAFLGGRGKLGRPRHCFPVSYE